MILFKASGATYRHVVAKQVHAFPFRPKDVQPHEFVLLSKNRVDCRPTEGQIQYVAKLLSVEAATDRELESLFPGARAGERWGCIARLYWSKPLGRSFNLSQVPGLNARHYDTAQEFARIDGVDEHALFEFLCRSNPDTILDFVNNAEPPGPAA